MFENGLPVRDMTALGCDKFKVAGELMAASIVQATEQAYFYGAGLFLRSRPISTEQAYFYEAGPILYRESMHIFIGQVCFHGVASFLWNIRTFLQRRLTSIK